jgi:hypothetical protein
MDDSIWRFHSEKTGQKLSEEVNNREVKEDFACLSKPLANKPLASKASAKKASAKKMRRFSGKLNQEIFSSYSSPFLTFRNHDIQ